MRKSWLVEASAVRGVAARLEPIRKYQSLHDFERALSHVRPPITSLKPLQTNCFKILTRMNVNTAEDRGQGSGGIG